jgi:hypothetical protein
MMPKKPVELQTIAGGDYAVAKNCPVGKIKDAFQFLYGKWLARSSRELRPAPSFLLMAAQERPQSTEGPVVVGRGGWSGGDAVSVWAHGYLCAMGGGEVRIREVFRDPHSAASLAPSYIVATSGAPMQAPE